MPPLADTVFQKRISLYVSSLFKISVASLESRRDGQTRAGGSETFGVRM